MHARVEKLPGGLVVAIPESLAAELGLREGSAVEVCSEAGHLLVRPAGAPTLAELVAGITPENRHGEHFAGAPVGRERL